MRIAFFISEPWEQEYFEASSLAGEHELLFYFHPLTHEQVPETTDVEAVSVFVDSVLDASMLEQFPNLKLIATRSTGFDHIDKEVCKKRGITIATVPAYGANTVAEHAFALLLSLSKRIFDGYEQVREGRGFNPHALRGFDLLGRTLGVIGTGNIGTHAISIGKGFGMNVIAYDAFPKEGLDETLGFTYVSLDELLQQSDVITVHVPYLPATHHLLNSENMQQLKQGAVLLNTSRGAVIETQAIVDALEDGRLRGAGLDVLEEEQAAKDEMAVLTNDGSTKEALATMLANHVLIDRENVIVTPHSAFNTEEALRRILATTEENIACFVAGEPKNTVQ